MTNTAKLHPGVCIAIASVSLLTACSNTAMLQDTTSALAMAGSPDPVIAAAGDIACEPHNGMTIGQNSGAATCQMQATSDLLIGDRLAAVLPLGDVQYEYGALASFQRSYAPTWGRVKNITRPAVGNHEYGTPRAAGYFSYFGSAAGDPTKGYYSYDIGSWHLIALNSNCREVGGCEAGSPQERWLRADLAAHPTRCTIAYWHHPRFSSGEHGSDTSYDAFWRSLYAAGVEIVLNGHDHDYERFAPQTPQAQIDNQRGIRQFVVGTGGKNHYRFTAIRANSEVRNAETFGVLKLTLHPEGYGWQFAAIPEATFTDSGSGACH